MKQVFLFIKRKKTNSFQRDQVPEIQWRF